MTPKTAAVVLTTLLALIFLGCSDSDDKPSPTDLQTARGRWEDAGISDYQYEIRLRCMCEPVAHPVTAVVEDGHSVGVTDATGLLLDEPEYHGFATLDMLFERLQAALYDDYVVQDMEYDSEYGFPTRFGLSGPCTDCGISGEVTNFRPLQ